MRLVVLVGLGLVVAAVGPANVAAAVEVCQSEAAGEYECVTERVVVEQIRPQYEYGLYGATNLSNYTPPHAEWPTDFAPGRSVPVGVHVGATYERITTLYAGGNVSVNMSSAHRPQYVDFNGLQTYEGGAIHALQYQINLSPKDLMNGVSDLYLRAAVRWLPSNYSAHYLNVVTLDDDGQVRSLVAAARYMLDAPSTDPDDALSHGDRLYYHFTGLFLTGRVYTVNEYVVTKGSPPLALPELEIYAAEGQDIADDGLTTIRLFPGSQAEAYFARGPDHSRQFLEAGWGVRAYTGMGAGGTVGILEGNSTMPSQTLRVRFAPAQAYVDESAQPANKVRVTVPLRVTVPVNVMVDVTPYKSFNDRLAGTAAGPTRTYSTPQPITGTFNHEFTLDPSTTWSGGDATHYYDLTLRFTLPATSCAEFHQCSFLTYPMSEMSLPNGASSFHIHEQSGANLQTSHVVYAQPWVEVVEGYAQAPVESDSSANLASILLGVAIIVGGVLLAGAAVVTIPLLAPVSIPLLLTGAGTIAAGAVFIGTVTIVGGALGLPPSAIFNGETLRLAAQFVGFVTAAVGCVAAYSPFGPFKKLPTSVLPLPRLAGGALCAAGLVLAADGVEGLLNFIIDVVKVIKSTVELVGHGLVAIMDVASEILSAWAPWARDAYVILLALTAMWILREFLLWLLNLLWPFTQQMSVRARSHHQRLENTVEALSVPGWDTVMYRFGAIRGRYWRFKRGGNPE